MPKLKLTKTAIAKLKAPTDDGKQVIHWDTEQTGLGVLCSGVTNTKSYVVQWDVKGKTRRETLGKVDEWHRAEKTLEDARTAAAKLVLLMREGIDPKAKRHADQVANTTLQQILDRYLTEQELSDNSKRLYRYMVENYLDDWLHLPLRDITSDMVRLRYGKVKAKVQRRPGNGRFRSKSGAATANATLLTLKTLWNYAEDIIPDLPKNPAKLKRGQRYRVPARDLHIRGDQLPKFYSAVLELNNRTMSDYILLLLFTGMRREEAASLRWADIDFSQRIIRIPAHRTKTQRELDLPMSDFLYDLLVARRALGFENDYVFPGEGKMGYLNDPTRALRQAGTACGIPNLAPHDLRRTFITVAEQCHIPPMAVPALVNHSLGSSQTASYNQTSAADLASAMQTITDRMKALCGVPVVEGAIPLRA